jgi:hypothetical protein
MVSHSVDHYSCYCKCAEQPNSWVTCTNKRVIRWLNNNLHLVFLSPRCCVIWIIQYFVTKHYHDYIVRDLALAAFWFTLCIKVFSVITLSPGDISVRIVLDNVHTFSIRLCPASNWVIIVSHVSMGLQVNVISALKGVHLVRRLFFC